MTTKRIVVCAANRYGKSIVFLGARHFDERMREHMAHYNIDHLRRNYGEEQGFIDQWGNFMDRKEALTVAREAGQLNLHRRKTLPEYRLFSEDLY